MQVTLKLVLILLICQLATGCGKADTEETAAPDESAAGQTQNSPDVDDPEKPATQASQLPDAAPLKGLQWIQNGPVTIEPGKVYVVEFWATWCAPCKVSIPHLTELQDEYKDRDVTIVGISTESAETVKPFVENMGEAMDYAVAVDTEGFVQRNYMEAFNKQGIPQAFLINENGKIVWEGHPMDNLDRVLKLVVQGDFDPVAYAQQKAEEAAMQQQVMNWFADYFQKIQTDGLTEEIKQIASNFIENAPADGLNSFAWNILTRVPEENRDLQAALNAAEKANRLTDGKDPSVLDTYALALFETGKIQEAIDMQEKAVELTSDYPQAQQELKQRLEHYKAALNDAI